MFHDLRLWQNRAMALCALVALVLEYDKTENTIQVHVAVHWAKTGAGNTWSRERVV